MTASEIWHLFAGLAGLVLSLVVGISTWIISNAASALIDVVREMTVRVDNLSERVAKLEGRMNGTH